MRAGSRGWPLPTTKAAALAALGLFPALLTQLSPSFGYVALALDAAVLLLCWIDFRLAPGPERLVARRPVEPILSSGVANPVHLEVEARRGGRIDGEIRDAVPSGPKVENHRQRFTLSAEAPLARLGYRLTPVERGDLAFGDLHVRSFGPLGLCARQWAVPAARAVKVYPDLTALSREALALALAESAVEGRAARRVAEGREFESLRDYQPGDDFRTVDWKATARRGKPMVRAFQPEQHQPVLLLLDCGRHMAGRVRGRRKLDYAVDAALRLAKVSLDQGDLVGVTAFARQVHAHLAPRRGPEHLRALTHALYRLDAALEESDYGQALDLSFTRHHRRTLVAIFTDLTDPDSSSALLARALRLRPRHLPLVVSLLDEELDDAAAAEPTTAEAAYVRQTAVRIEEEYQLTAARLRDAGGLVIRAPVARFAAAAVNEYLRVKARGLL